MGKEFGSKGPKIDCSPVKKLIGVVFGVNLNKKKPLPSEDSNRRSYEDFMNGSSRG